VLYSRAPAVVPSLCLNQAERAFSRVEQETQGCLELTEFLQRQRTITLGEVANERVIFLRKGQAVSLVESVAQVVEEDGHIPG
jgi:hypothetical protein